MPRSPSLFDVERFRSESLRLAVTPRVSRPTLVLGSTQRAELVATERSVEHDVDVQRRRGGGGAVFLEPGDHLWIDAWIPRDDPLWTSDVVAAAEWVGTWWVGVLAGFGLTGLEVHTGRAEPGEFGELVCFAGRGPGEVFSSGRKVVGLSQWRSREGALFSSCAYTRWDPRAMVHLFNMDEGVRKDFARRLASRAVGVAELLPTLDEVGALRGSLLGAFPALGR